MKTFLVPALAALFAITARETFTSSTDDTYIVSDEVSDGALSLTSASSHPYVLSGSPQDLFLHLSLTAANLPAVPRPSMNLSLVIDKSGSMASEDKLLHAKSAAEQLVSRLEPTDNLSIVVFDDVVHTVVPSTPACERETLVRAIRGIQTGRNTNLHGGMVTGYEEVLQHFDESRLNRVLLLSDGMANEGITDRSQIESRASQCRSRGVHISTMGIGLSYDEVLMSGIARGAGGNYYYVDDPESVGRHLDKEIDELSRLVARDLEVRIDLGDGVLVKDVYGYNYTVENGTLRISVNDKFSGEHHKVVMRLSVSGTANSARELVTTSLHYVNAATKQRGASRSAPIQVQFTESIQQVKSHARKDVLTHVEVVHNATAILDAMKLQKAGQLKAAQDLLSVRYSNCKLLNDTELKSEELDKMLERIKQILSDLETTWSNPAYRRDLQLGSELEALGYMGD